MQTRILTLFARSPVHVGAGNSVGAVDSPVMRERHTRIPVVPGSSLKGVLRDCWQADSDADERLWLYGNEQSAGKDEFRAGALLIGEARVLAFPVRSAKGGFAWITCPLALARYKRDTGADFQVPTVAGDEDCLASADVILNDKVVLEEYCFAATGEPGFCAALEAIVDDDVWAQLPQRCVVVSDEIFSHFTEHACEVVTRVRIDDETGTVAQGALFNQENVPSETLFYAVIGAQEEKGKTASEPRSAAAALETLNKKLAVNPVLQVGGDETVGLGYCSAKLV